MLILGGILSGIEKKDKIMKGQLQRKIMVLSFCFHPQLVGYRLRDCPVHHDTIMSRLEFLIAKLRERRMQQPSGLKYVKWRSRSNELS